MPRRSRPWLAGIVCLALASITLSAVPATATPDVTSYVNPFVGTMDGGPDFGHGGGAGMDFPGAVVPFGMMQWSPDTVRSSGGGYKYEDDRLRGFSMTHISGPGCTGAQDFPVTPISGPITTSPATHGTDYVQTFSHANEQATPGSYAMTTDAGVKTELTASTRGGVGRFTFPTDKVGTLLLNVTGSINGVDDAEATVKGNTVSGWAKTGGFCGAESRYYVYFSATFDRPFQTYGTWKDDVVQPGQPEVRGHAPAKVSQPSSKVFGRLHNGPDGRPLTNKTTKTEPRDVSVKGPGSGVYLQFDTSKNQAVQMRTAVSYVSVAGAARNLATEIGGRDYDAVRNAAHRLWADRLGQIKVSDGAPSRLTAFYTALYHALLQPYVFDDVDGAFTGFDHKVHQVRKGHHEYATFSGWDIYRSEVQLIALLAPDVGSDIAQSLYDDAHSIGDVWDRWSHQNTITGVMNGDPYHSIIATMYAFGARDFDAGGALAAMVKGANRIGEDKATKYTERPGNADYLKLGYVPGDPATTLEYGLADFGIAQLAQRLGQNDTYQGFMKRSHAWETVYNPLNDWIQPRFGDGSFLSPFDPADSGWYVEGNGAQYHWMTYSDVTGLFNAMGGRAKAAKRLDTFFTKLNAGSHEPYAYLGNEPSLQSPWLYAWAGQPYKTQDVVARARVKLFKSGPDGMVGNDDLGTMSAWRVFAGLGMYPAIPGRAEMVLNSPEFPKTTITRSSGQKIVITAPGASDTIKYVQSLKVDGKASSRAWLPESFVASGGKLDYVVDDTPNKAFGSDPKDAPPSFGTGARPFLSAISPGMSSLEPGDSMDATLRVQSVGAGDTVTWTARPPAGITVTPSSGTLKVGTASRTDQKVKVSVAAGAKLDYYSVPFELTASGASVGNTGVTLNVAKKGTIEWYQNNAGISDDGASGQANFDGGGWSYSKEALAKAGITPGGTVSWNGFAFTWPGRRSGQLDNVQAGGQAVDLADVPKGASKLAFLGAAGNGDAPSTVTVTYTDGSTSDGKLEFSDWALGADAYPPRFGNEIVAKTPYRNTSDGGNQALNIYVFAATPIALDAGKQVKSVTLNTPKGDAGSLHVFAWAFA